MPLVFVHGVNSRMRPGYQESVAARDALFRRFTLTSLLDSPDGAGISNPYWGDEGARFRWGLACLPQDDETEELGGTGDVEVAALTAAAAAAAGPDVPPDKVLTEAARTDFPGTVDLVLAAGAVEAGEDAAAFAEVAARAAAYADAHPEPPAWVAEVGSDAELLDRLGAEVVATEPITGRAGTTPPDDEFEDLGLGDLWGAVRAGADRVRVAVGDAVGTPAYGLVRRHVAPTVATFFGDVFEYLSHRGTPQDPGPIVDVVATGIRTAAEAVTDKDPHLVVVGHSLGGVIAYDLVRSFLPDVHVDALVTVGSQVGLFEELKLFVGADPTVPRGGTTRLRRPATVEHWVNVYDLNDLLSYRLEPIVEDVSEFRYASGDLLTAHGAYFGQPRFHRRLAERLTGLLRP